jgi:hypothetical protein
LNIKVQHISRKIKNKASADPAVADSMQEANTYLLQNIRNTYYALKRNDPAIQSHHDAAYMQAKTHSLFGVLEK